LRNATDLIGEIDRWVLSRCLLVLAERARQQRSVRLFRQPVDRDRDRRAARRLASADAGNAAPGRRSAGDRVSPGDAQTHLHDLAAFAAEARKLEIHIVLSGFEAGGWHSNC
jgi:hypothetical protein